MWRYVARRLVLAIPTLLGASIIVFAMVHLAPGDPIAAIMPVDASKEQIEDIKKAYGFDRPLPVQYLKWLGHVVTGDLGKSIATRRAVILDVRDSLANSLVLALSSSILAFGAGIALGLLAAFKQGRALDKIASAIAVTGVSVPHYWAGIILIIIFSVQLNWLPAEPRDLPARHPGAAGRDSRTRDVLRAAEPPGRRAADVHRPADRAALMVSSLPWGVSGRGVRGGVSPFARESLARSPRR